MSASMNEVKTLVLVNEDRTEARLRIPTNMLREEVTLPLCEVLLRDKQVEVTRAVRAAVRSMIETMSEDHGVVEAVVARAALPTHGEDAQLQWFIDDPGGVDSDVSHYDRISYVAVKAGDVLGQLIPATLGEDGRDVTGGTLAARPGKPLPMKFDGSILIDGEKRLIAQLDGVLTRSSTSAGVTQLLEVAEYVDFSIGNIRFTGDVRIAKGVRDRFVVHADGNIDVGGLVEAATLEAGGDLILRAGMAGREQGQVRVGGNLVAHYLDAIRGEIGRDLIVQREIINTELIVHGGLCSPRATLMGGVITVTGRVELSTLGSAGGAMTSLVLGTVPRLEPMLMQLNLLRQRLVARLQPLEDEQQRIIHRGRRSTAADRERQTEIMYELQQCRQAIENATRGRDLLEKRITAKRTIDVTITRQLHHGAMLIVDELAHRIHSDVRGPLRLTGTAGGELILHRGRGPAQPLINIADISHAAPCAA